MKKSKPVQPRKKTATIKEWAESTNVGRLTVNIPREEYNRFKAVISEQGLTMTEVVKNWVDEYINKHY